MFLLCFELLGLLYLVIAATLVLFVGNFLSLNLMHDSVLRRSAGPWSLSGLCFDHFLFFRCVNVLLVLVIGSFLLRVGVEDTGLPDLPLVWLRGAIDCVNSGADEGCNSPHLTLANRVFHLA